MDLILKKKEEEKKINLKYSLIIVKKLKLRNSQCLR